MGRRTSRGFTLVELLVVITIIGALVALLLPAIGAAREAARRAQCTNNQKQLATAIATFDGAKTHFPAYRASHPSLGENSGAMGITWVGSLLPYFEQQQLYDVAYGASSVPNYMANASVPYIAVLICPSDPPETKEGGPLSYVINCGRDDAPAPRDVAQARNMSGPPDWRGNGISHVRLTDQLRKANRLLDQEQTTARVNDGVSNTLLLSENIHAGNWWSAKNATSGANWNTWVERAVGMTWTPDIQPTAVRPNDPIRHINGGRNAVLTQSDWIQNMAFARPSSNHPGVVVAAMADSSVRTVSDEIDYKVYCLMMTSDTNQLGTPGGPPGMSSAPWLATPLDQADIK